MNPFSLKGRLVICLIGSIVGSYAAMATSLAMQNHEPLRWAMASIAITSGSVLFTLVKWWRDTQRGKRPCTPARPTTGLSSQYRATTCGTRWSDGIAGSASSNRRGPFMCPKPGGVPPRERS